VPSSCPSLALVVACFVRLPSKARDGAAPRDLDGTSRLGGRASAPTFWHGSDDSLKETLAQIFVLQGGGEHQEGLI
jgi:hypothetical protein